ncbi:MAG: Fe-S cluster assembly protein SufD [Anaerolineaceae bacterium]|nr:Fe-S cluster assembly protein SufD [Anaerolineaceae bacterium]
MTAMPQVVIRKKGSQGPIAQDFAFHLDGTNLSKTSEFVAAYRQNAWKVYESLSIPTTKEEAWRRTDLSNLNPGNFKLPEVDQYKSLDKIPEKLLQPLTGETHGGQVVLMAGGAKTILDPALTAQGVIFTDLSTAEKNHPDILKKVMGKVVQPSEGKFAALPAALAQNGVLLYVPRGVVVEQPVHSLLWGPGAGLAYLSHILVYLEEDAAVTYVHEAASPTQEGEQKLHAGLVELYVGPRAQLRWVELQSWGENVWNFSHERVKVAEDGNIDWVFGAVGSHVTKNFSDLELTGSGSSGRMSGFYFTDRDQHLDHDTQQNHLAPHTTSDLLFKGALLGKSRSVWQGMIYVAPGADKIDGFQANRNLVLSEGARADSIPGLEILADDVRCSHGATVGRIDQDQVFYLLSRGIPGIEAERLIVEGFFDPIMQRIPFEGVRQRFQNAIHNKMESYQG